ncbi:MAG TPA: hypothetical protein VHB98_07020 [Chloroflexota bacterium]|nr:hypothetical protein [Chloroflexota bacterium]
MDAVALKLVLTPALIGVASLAGRRWGPAVSGWLIGLPFTSGPVTFFLALAHGDRFAATAAVGTLTGTIAALVFCVAYAWVALHHGWLPALFTACLGFAAATIVLHALALPLPLVAPLVLLTLLAAPRLMPRQVDAVAADARPPRWDLPARMGVATAFVLLLTGLAPAIGPQMTGLLAPFPLFATILAAFAHQRQGAIAAAQVLRGLLLGLFAFASFFVLLAALLVPAGLVLAFAAAVLTALLIQAGSLRVLRQKAAA